MFRDLASLAGWAFIPNLATKFVLEAYYGFTYKFGEKPKPGTPLFMKHRWRVHTALVLGFLLLTIFDSYDRIQKEGNFYRALGVDYDTSERMIKSKFRKLAAQHHPDKQTAINQNDPAVFLALKVAQDTLLNPTKRFAYDRFGPTMLLWEQCASIKEYLNAGFQYYLPSYVGTALMTLALGAMGYLDWGKFWRYLFGGALILIEIYTITRPEYPGILTNVINPVLSFLPWQSPLLPFQFLTLVRKIAFAGSIAISQVGPSSINREIRHNELDSQRLARLEFLTLANEMDSTRLLRMSLAPFGEDTTALQNLKKGMTSWLHDNTLRADPLVRQAVTEIVDPETARAEAAEKVRKEKARLKALRKERGEPDPEMEEPPPPESKIYDVL